MTLIKECGRGGSRDGMGWDDGYRDMMAWS